MSLTVDGVWKVGVWATTVWATGVWREGAPPTSATLSGTVTAGVTEANIRTGGKTLIVTLANDTWVASGATFDAQRQAILNGIASTSGLFAFGEVVTSVVRTSATQVTITLSAEPTYDITVTDTITVTVPSAALVTSLIAVVATPTFTVSVVAPPVPASDRGLGGDDVPYRKSPHRGWDRAEWKRRKQFEDGLENTLRETYQRLMGIPAVAAKVDVIVKPVIVNDEPKIDWTKLAKSYARSNALIKLDQEEADLRAAIDEEDEFLMAMI